MRPYSSLQLISLAFLGILNFANAASHPADTDGDSALSIDEITSYTAAWKSGGVWPAGPSPISDAYYEQAVFIWKNGETYRDAGISEAPYNWVPDSGSAEIFLPGAPLSAEPFDRVTITGIDSTLDLEVTYSLQDRPGVFKTLWNPADNLDAIEILVPLNPFTLTGEGVVELQIRNTANNDSWRAPPLQLESLPPAPGATADTLADLRSKIAAASARQGFTPSIEDVANFSSVPQSAKALVYMKAWLDHSGNPDSLANTIANMSAEELDLTDRLFGKVQLDASDTAILSISSVAPKKKAHMRIASVSGPRISSDGNAFLEITNPLELSNAMQQQAAAETSVKDKFSAKDGANDLINLQGNLIAARDKIGSKLKVAGEGSAVLAAITTTLMIHDFMDHFDAGNLPSHFTDLALTIDGPGRGYFLEDGTNCETATITVKATVESDGFDMLKTLGQVLPGGALGKPGTKDGFAWADKHFPGLDQMDLEPNVWTGIGVGGDLYSSTVADAKLEIVGYNDGKAGMDFKPAAVGVGELTVTVSSAKFSGHTITKATNYSTSPIVVQFVNPNLRISGDEDSITYQAKFLDADQIGDQNMQWSVSAGTVTSRRNLGGGFYEIDWTPPFDKSSFPVSIVAKYSSVECLRGLPGAPERKQSISVQTDDWDIIPATTCVDKEQTVQFDVSGSEADPIEVTWSITSGLGAIHPTTGLFTASAVKGPVVVRATPTAVGAEDDFKETSFNVDCGLIVSWELPLDAAPVSPETIHPTNTGFILAGETDIDVDVVKPDIYVTYETITPPADGELVGVVTGSYHGAGVFYSHDPAENQALVDDSNSLKNYVTTGEFGTTYEYTVEAGFSAKDFDETSRHVNLLGGPDGTEMELLLDAGTSSSGAVNAEIVAWNWFFSNGTQAAGETVTPAFDRGTTTFTARLQVVDTNGNSAEYIQSFTIVEIFGDFKFGYSPDLRQVTCLVSAFEFPPMEIDGVIFEATTDPERCKLSLYIDGGKSATVSISSSSAGIPPDTDPPAYYIGFGGTDG